MIIDLFTLFPEHFEWFRALGVEFKPSFVLDWESSPWVTEGSLRRAIKMPGPTPIYGCSLYPG